MAKEKTVQFRISEADLLRIDAILPSGVNRSSWISMAIMIHLEKFEGSAALRKEAGRIENLSQMEVLFPKLVTECIAKTQRDELMWRLVEDSALGQYAAHDKPFSWRLKDNPDENRVSLTITLPNNPACLNGMTYADLDQKFAEPLLDGVWRQVNRPLPKSTRAFIEKTHLPISNDIELETEGKSLPQLINEARTQGDPDSKLRVHHPEQGLLTYSLGQSELEF